MKTYKDLNTLTDIAQAMDAGKVVEYYSARQKWLESNKEAIYTNTEYRTVEEMKIEDYPRKITKKPEQGDKIMVWDVDEKSATPRLFVTFWKDAVIAGHANSNMAISWAHWKPIDKKPIEGWMFPLELSSRKEASGMIHVREVLEDE